MALSPNTISDLRQRLQELHVEAEAIKARSEAIAQARSAILVLLDEQLRPGTANGQRVDKTGRAPSTFTAKVRVALKRIGNQTSPTNVAKYIQQAGWATASNLKDPSQFITTVGSVLHRLSKENPRIHRLERGIYHYKPTGKSTEAHAPP